MFKIEDGRDKFYQWDLNRKLIVEDSTIPQVHFSNAIGDTAYVVNAVDGYAQVPNILLQQDCPLLVYGYDGEATKHTAIFEVIHRNKPEDYIYSEEEIKNYDALEKRIEKLEKGGGAGGGSDISLGIKSATPGQTVIILKTDIQGKPTEWKSVEFPEAGEVKEWDLINYILIPEDAEEANALTFNQDLNGEPFSLIKARIVAFFPKYTGESTIPSNHFCMINGRTAGGGALNPLSYTSGWNPPSKTQWKGTFWEVDFSENGVYKEKTIKVNSSSSNHYDEESINGNNVYSVERYNFGGSDFSHLYPITSIGGTAMLLFPGCKIYLYGVRA